MLGATIGDLDTGDTFEPVRYSLTSLMATEYAHGVEDPCEWYYSARNPWGRQIRPPTMIHADKLRLLEVNCPREPRLTGFRGPDARIHYEYHARHHSPAFVGEELVVSGGIRERYEKRGRTFLHYELEVRTTEGRLVTTYSDRTLLKYAKDEAA